MSVELGRALKAARLGKGLPAKAVADLVKVSTAAVYQWEKGSTEPTGKNLVDVATFLELDLPSARRGEVVANAGSDKPDLEPELTIPPPGQETPAPRIGNRDVEVRGISIGGSEDDEADFSFNGQVVDYAHRPAGLLHRRDVFMVRTANDSMSPAHEAGDPLFVDSHQDPMPGEDVIVELHGREGEPGPAYIKRLVRRSGSKVTVRQFNPPQELEFDRSRIKKLWRVVPRKEMV